MGAVLERVAGLGDLFAPILSERQDLSAGQLTTEAA
jgi:hypothetical protein